MLLLLPPLLLQLLLLPGRCAGALRCKGLGVCGGAAN
jgi:hypothetical protein